MAQGSWSFHTGAATADAQALKIGFVNFGRLVDESPQANAAKSALEAEFLPRQRDVAAQQKTLQEKGDKLQKEAAVMSEAERTKAERDGNGYIVHGKKTFTTTASRLTARPMPRVTAA